MCVLDADELATSATRTATRVDAAGRTTSTAIAGDDADKGDFAHYMLKEIYEQPEALENAMRGRLDDADATAHFGGLNLDAAAAPPGRPHHPDRLRHQLPRGAGRRVPVRGVRPHPGRGRVRQRVPLPQPADRPQHASSSPSPRSGETADTLAALREVEAQGAPDAGDLQRRRQHASPARPTAASTCTPARRSASPAPRRSPSQVRRAGHARPVLRPHAAPVEHRRGSGSSTSCRRCPTRSARRCDCHDAGQPIAGEVRRRATTSSTWAGSTFSRWPWKGR